MIGLNSDDRVHIILTTPNPWGLPKRGHIKRVTDLRSGYSYDAKRPQLLYLSKRETSEQKGPGCV